MIKFRVTRRHSTIQSSIEHVYVVMHYFLPRNHLESILWASTKTSLAPDHAPPPVGIKRRGLAWRSWSSRPEAAALCTSEDRAAMTTTTVLLLVCCALVGAAVGQGEPCTVGPCRHERWTVATSVGVLSCCGRPGWHTQHKTAVLKSPVCVSSPTSVPDRRPRSAVRMSRRGGSSCRRSAVSGTIPRVTGGEDALIGEFPWMATLQFSNGTAPLVHGCGASLITSRHVLTAAHCVTDLKPGIEVAAVILGELDFDSNPDCLPDSPGECAEPPVTVGIDGTFIHDDFQNIPEAGLPNDIAVLKLAKEVTFTRFIRPVCLMTDLSVLRGKSDKSAGRRGYVHRLGPQRGRRRHQLHACPSEGDRTDAFDRSLRAGAAVGGVAPASHLRR